VDVRVIALYSGRIGYLAGRPGVRFRSRKKAGCTLVPCRIDALDGRSVAVPECAVPDGTPPPLFRVQCETVRAAVEERQAVCVVLSAEGDDRKSDPEQTLLSPIFDDGHRMIYEFRRAYIVRIDKRGDLETRFVAIDPVRGLIGTKTVHRFDTRLLPLASRCLEHLHGTIDLFPMRDRPMSGRYERIPEGEANLGFRNRAGRTTNPALGTGGTPGTLSTG